MNNQPIFLDSITDAGPQCAGQVAISGSHGGMYPASLAARAGLRAVVFNDAGIGLERAGVGGVMALDRIAMAAAAVDCMSARIADARDMHERGRLSTINETARKLGLEPGMTVREAAAILTRAPTPQGTFPPYAEGQSHRVLVPGEAPVYLLDSASMVGPEHAGQIVVTGSHGALIGGAPERALKAPARIAVFNDAGLGPEGIATTRLPALGARGIAAVTVSAGSARIGDAASALESGVISTTNAPAGALGARPGRSLKSWLREVLEGT